MTSKHTHPRLSIPRRFQSTSRTSGSTTRNCCLHTGSPVLPPAPSRRSCTWKPPRAPSSTSSPVPPRSQHSPENRPSERVAPLRHPRGQSPNWLARPCVIWLLQPGSIWVGPSVLLLGSPWGTPPLASSPATAPPPRLCRLLSSSSSLETPFFMASCSFPSGRFFPCPCTQAPHESLACPFPSL